MGVGLITAGLVFLVNPCYNVVDFLPDFIGFFLIFKGLSKTSALEARLSDARDIFFRLALVDLSKILFMYFYAAGRTGSALGPDGMPLDALSMKASGETYLLVATFVYGVLETVFFIGAVKALFDGFDGLGRRFSSDSVNAQRTVSVGKNGASVKKDVSVPVKYVTMVFFAVRCALSVICELPALSLSSRYGDVTVGALSADSIKPPLYIITSAAVLAFGAVYLFMSVRFWNSVRRDKPFIDAMKAAYGRFNSDNPTVKLGKRMRTVMVFFMIACVLSIRFTSDEATLLPGAFCAVFLIATAVLMKDYFRKKAGFIAVVASSVLYGVTSGIYRHYESVYFLDYSRLEVFRLKGAGRLYPPVAVWGAVEAVFLTFSLVVLACVFFRASRSHIALAGEEFHVSDEITFEVDKYRSELASSIRKRRRFAAASGVAHLALRFILPLFEPFAYFLFPPVMSGNREVDVPGQAMSYLTFLYFVVAAVWITAAVVYCLFSSSEMYRPMAKGTN